MMEHTNILRSNRHTCTELIASAQQLVRSLAERNILQALTRTRDCQQGNVSNEELEGDARNRSRSVVSLRDIQRVFSLFDFFADKMHVWESNSIPKDHSMAIVLSVMIVYYMRLDSESRLEFIEGIESKISSDFLEGVGIENVLKNAVDAIIKDTEVPAGIALTEGLKENIFMTLVCSLSRTPLMIVGPPGSSKTLSVNIVSDNANGEDSPSPFYRHHARISLYHYQCSRQSTSKEIADVFKKATQRQDKLDPEKQRCVVFMDEAGLPEEDKESLKVLHYLLEGHMSIKAHVGFVAITNHVLDAAKSNRCIMLLRQEPDANEMLTITRGVLFDLKGISRVKDVDIDGELLSNDTFALCLCNSYEKLLHRIEGCSYFGTFFGLRDFIYLLKAIRLASEISAVRMKLPLLVFVGCVERNFNGVPRHHLKRIVNCFVEPLEICAKSNANLLLRHPLDVIAEALSSSDTANDVSNRPRFKLIIDCTEDDSIMRLLLIAGIIDLPKKSLFKLSHLPEEVDMEKLNLISGVKFAALKGNLAILSQTDPVQESFYDLFNQHFRAVAGRNGKISLYANIAVGGISRRSLVHPAFECIVHVRESKMSCMPAPFLNRFEKFILSVQDVLERGLLSLGGEVAACFERARQKTFELACIFGSNGLVGIIAGQTINSIFADMLPRLKDDRNGRPIDNSNDATHSLSSALMNFVQQTTSLKVEKADIDYIIEIAMESLDDTCCLLLEHLHSGNGSQVANTLQQLSSMDVLTDGCPHLHRLLSILFQMLVTRSAMLQLLQLATPETLFSNRSRLPIYLISAYFLQEHFSLNRLLSRVESNDQQHNQSSFTMLYTRTDATIHSIPSMFPDGTVAETSSFKLFHRFVSENSTRCVVEHLSKIRNEASLRSFLEAWIQSDTKSMCLILVDMSRNESVESTNFVRMLAEQLLVGTRKKSFILLLHYPASLEQGLTWYPALFLGGWNHIFLDNIGVKETSIDLEYLIRAACESENLDEGIIHSQLASTVTMLLPRVLPHVASRMWLYPKQDGGQSLFSARKTRISRLMKTEVGKATISQILCEKYARMWSMQALLATINGLTFGLLQGTSQLSMCMSMQSILMETFDSFIALSVKGMNEWLNLDILWTRDQSKETLKVFGIVLAGMPVLPLEELILYRERVPSLPRLPFEPEQQWLAVCFPFFYFISTYLDELVAGVMPELSAREHVRIVNDDADDIFCRIQRRLDTSAAEIGCHGEQTVESQRSKTVKDVVEFVSGHSPDLEKDYLHQFIEWKVGCQCNAVILSWFENQMHELNNASYPVIICIHVVSKLHEFDLVKVAAFADFVQIHTPLSALEIPKAIQMALPTSSGLHLFTPLLEHFEHSLCHESINGNQEWVRDFTQFVIQLPFLLRQTEVLPFLFERLRLLTFSYIQARIRTDSEIHRFEDPNLSKFIEGLQFLDPDKAVETVDLALQYFLSLQWLEITDAFVAEDFGCLISLMKGGCKKSKRSRYLSVLIQNACKNYPSTGGKTFELSTAALTLLNSKVSLSCACMAEFGEGETRVRIPHFIPSWLSGTTNNGSVGEQKPVAFFNMYEHCFGDCLLSAATFEMIFQSTEREARSLSSEDLLVRLQRDIDLESGLTKSEYARLQRLRIANDSSMSLVGTTLSAMIADARLLCFLAKVTWELATHGHALALTGTYGIDGRLLLENTIAIASCRWRDYFFSSIIKTRGEGTAVCLLSERGSLSSLGFCEPYKHRIKSSQDGCERVLRDAEMALADAINEEAIKTQEWRLCPHCHMPFIIAAINCGQFTCGKHFHDVKGKHGCGQAFDIGHAGQYAVDQALLETLRIAVEAAREDFASSRHGGELWSAARSFNIPVLVVEAILDNRFPSCLPSLSAIDSNCISGSNLLIRNILNSQGMTAQIAILPDLVELYMWLHTQFRHLISRRVAFELLMKDLMKRDLLLQRFDRTFTDHILLVWKRVVLGFNALITATKGKLPWQCEEIEIPFRSLGDASLLSLLSEGVDPTSGNDFLFLAIQYIILQYNDRAAIVSDLHNEKGDTLRPCTSVHPRFLMSACGSVHVLNRYVQLDESELNCFAQTSWDPELGEIDRGIFDNKLKDHLAIHSAPPLIGSPHIFLREVFCFRDEDDNIVHTNKAGVVILKSSSGEYFANQQDYQLFADVATRLGCFGARAGGGDLGRTLNDYFHAFGYEDIRNILEGLRTLVEIIGENGKRSQQTFNSVKEALIYLHVSNLEELGFWSEFKTQMKLILSLNSMQLEELVLFLGRQLASEAYLFRALPLCMTDPLSPSVHESLIHNLDKFRDDRGVRRSHELLDEFVKDILSYYERMIRDCALDTSDTLTTMLTKNNCCDKSDPIFALLPKEISVRNYLGLRQLLQQTKLRWLYNESLIECETSVPVLLKEKKFRPIVRGNCWLWEDQNLLQPVHEDNTLRQMPDMASNSGMWFETRSEVIPKSAVHHDNVNEHLTVLAVDVDMVDTQIKGSTRTEDEATHQQTFYERLNEVPVLTPREAAICLLQQWWRSRAHYLESDDEDMNDYVELMTPDVAISSIQKWWRKWSHKLEPNDQDMDYNLGLAQNNSAIFPFPYGSHHAEIDLRSWLNDCRLPQSAGDELVKHGVRELGDLKEFVSLGYLAELDGVSFFDKKKIEKGIEALIKTSVGEKG